MTASAAKSPPKSIYLVAVVFFVTTLLCMMQLLKLIGPTLGMERLTFVNVNWFAGYLAVSVCVACASVWLVVRQHPAATWLMFAMTLVWVVSAAIPPDASPFYSTARIYFNRALFVLPLIASCIYLARRHQRHVNR